MLWRILLHRYHTPRGAHHFCIGLYLLGAEMLRVMYYGYLILSSAKNPTTSIHKVWGIEYGWEIPVYIINNCMR
jgi:hypothetical protein